jgi:hypothetical protein
MRRICCATIFIACPPTSIRNARMKFRYPLNLVNRLNLALVTCLSLIRAACGGGGGGSAPPPPTPTSHVVNISWASNKEAAVNSIGGGYQVAISGQPVINVPFPYAASGASVTTTLMSGNYTVAVTAYSAMNPSTGIAASGVTSTSLPSTPFALAVPY